MFVHLYKSMMTKVWMSYGAKVGGTCGLKKKIQGLN